MYKAGSNICKHEQRERLSDRWTINSGTSGPSMCCSQQNEKVETEDGEQTQAAKQETGFVS